MPGIVIGDRIIMFKNNDGHVEVDGKKIVYSILISNDERLVVKIGDSVKDIVYSDDDGCVEVFINGTTMKFNTVSDRDLLLKSFAGERSGHHRLAEIKAPMPGLVVKVLVKKGDNIKGGESLVILEAMKMENEIRVSYDSEVIDLFVSEGDVVEKGQVIAALS